jgi:hypothetical protein
MEGDADPFYMKETTTSDSVHVEELLAEEALTILRHRFASGVHAPPFWRIIIHRH